MFEFSETLHLMDNWSIYKSKLTKATLWKSNSKVLYLLAYSADLASIEMWFRYSKKIITEWRNQYIKLYSKQSYGRVVDALRKNKPITIKSLFKRLYSKIQRYLTINNVT